MEDIKDTVKQIEEVEKPEESYNPSDKEKEIGSFIDKRVEQMKTFRKDVLGTDIEKIWERADQDYIPKDIQTGRQGKRFESDDELGLRSRLVPIESETQEWRSKNSEPTLLVKIQTALSIIIDKDPEAFFQSLTKKYDSTTKLAHSLWKSSWLLDMSKGQLKLFAFNLAKYGWAAGRTYPRILKRNKSVLVEYDTDDPEKSKYNTKEIVDYNGIHRENLDVYKTWIDEMSRPYDVFSTNDWYFEKDYDYDTATLEFGTYKNWKYVEKNAKEEQESGEEQEYDRTNLVTLGFYENKNKDLYGIYIPSQKIVLHSGPLPNDDGRLSLWHAPWLLRDSRSPYGIGLYEVIRQKKSLYDKMMNMTMDQLVLSIYKMFFYTGTSNVIGEGKIKIQPGKGEQIIGGDVKWMEVPGPGRESFEGLKTIKSGIDDDSGITPTLEGEITGKTLGEMLHAKEAALKRMNTPLDNIAWALQVEAFVSLSWLGQILSTPEVKEFSNSEELLSYEKETGLNRFEMNPQYDQEGNETGVQASFLPEIPLNLDTDKDDNLIESKKVRFFQVGKDILPEQLKWEGIITVQPRSILTPSLELERQRKHEMFNVLVPLLPRDPSFFAKPAKQLLKVNEEDLEDWLPDIWIQYLETGSIPQPLFTDQMVPGGETMKGQQGMENKGGPTVVPKGEVGPGQGANMLGKLKQTMGSMFRK